MPVEFLVGERAADEYSQHGATVLRGAVDTGDNARHDPRIDTTDTLFFDALSTGDRLDSDLFPLLRRG